MATSFTARQLQIRAATAESLQSVSRQPAPPNRKSLLNSRPLPEIPPSTPQHVDHAPIQENPATLRVLRSDVQRLSAELKSCRGQLKQKEDVNTQLENELRVAIEDRDYFKEQLGMASHHLNHLQSETNHKTIDEFFVDRWRGLLYEIKQCSVQHLESDRKATISKNTMIEYSNIVADPKWYLQSPRLRALLGQALAWRCLFEHVFTKQLGKGFCWAGRFDAAVRSLDMALDPARSKSKSTGALETDLREYHRWRASTALLLEPKIMVQERDASVKKVVEAMNHKLLPLLGKVKEEQRNTFCDSLFSIVRNAIALDSEFSKQRAVLSPFFPDATFQKKHSDVDYAEYAEIHNDPEKICESHSVHLVVAPGLLKSGSSEGDMYDETYILVASQVSLDRPQADCLRLQPENRSTPEVNMSVQCTRTANSVAFQALGPPPRRTQSTRSQMANRSGSQNARLQKDEGQQSRINGFKTGMKRLYQFLDNPGAPPINDHTKTKLLQ